MTKHKKTKYKCDKTQNNKIQIQRNPKRQNANVKKHKKTDCKYDKIQKDKKTQHKCNKIQIDKIQI